MPFAISLSLDVAVKFLKFTCTIYKIMLPHFVFHSDMSSLEGSKCQARKLEDPNTRLEGSRLEGSKYKARGLEARNTRFEGSRLEGSRLEIQGSKARGSRARGSKARHIEYSTCGTFYSETDNLKSILMKAALQK